MHLCYAPLNVKGKEVCGDDDCHDREYRRICTGHLCRFRPVSYTHLTLPTNREV